MVSTVNNVIIHALNVMAQIILIAQNVKVDYILEKIHKYVNNVILIRDILLKMIDVLNVIHPV